LKVPKESRKLFLKYIKKAIKPSPEMVLHGALVNVDIGSGMLKEYAGAETRLTRRSCLSSL
ncbi:MAG: hypothetical protein N2235_15985, partial [Fischerella sp.]|nr:hypothetical protein [Fischerella sp.]